MCAAPGSKTAQLIEMIHANEGNIPPGINLLYLIYLFICKRNITFFLHILINLLINRRFCDSK